MSEDIEFIEPEAIKPVEVKIYDPVVGIEDLDDVVVSKKGMKESTSKPKPKQPVAAKEEAAVVVEAEVVEPVVVASDPHVISDKGFDDVLVSKAVYKNVVAKKSLTVHHLQRRLNELGYSEAYLDKDGWYGDHTKSAVAKFQSDKNIPGDGLMDYTTMVAIFEGDNNVKVKP
jgi:hypothetical protein